MPLGVYKKPQRPNPPRPLGVYKNPPRPLGVYKNPPRPMGVGGSPPPPYPLYGTAGGGGGGGVWGGIGPIWDVLGKTFSKAECKNKKPCPALDYFRNMFRTPSPLMASCRFNEDRSLNVRGPSDRVISSDHVIAAEPRAVGPLAYARDKSKTTRTRCPVDVGNDATVDVGKDAKAKHGGKGSGGDSTGLRPAASGSSGSSGSSGNGKKNSGNPHTTGKIGAEHAVIAPPISKAKKIKRRSRKRFPA